MFSFLIFTHASVFIPYIHQMTDLQLLFPVQGCCSDLWASSPDTSNFFHSQTPTFPLNNIQTSHTAAPLITDCTNPNPAEWDWLIRQLYWSHTVILDTFKPFHWSVHALHPCFQLTPFKVNYSSRTLDTCDTHRCGSTNRPQQKHTHTQASETHHPRTTTQLLAFYSYSSEDTWISHKAYSVPYTNTWSCFILHPLSLSHSFLGLSKLSEQCSVGSS